MQESPGNLGSRVGLIYGSISLVTIIVVFFALPETKGRSLEELDELFQSRVRPWKSKSWKATGLGAQITTVENVARPAAVAAAATARHPILTASEVDVEQLAVGAKDKDVVHGKGQHSD